MTRTLEIGGGAGPVPGFTDRVEEDWGEKRLPFPDNTFSEVYSAQVIEHLPWFKIPAAIREVFRVLKPGGFFEVHTPDFAYLVDCYLKKIPATLNKARGENDGHPFRSVIAMLYGVARTPESPQWHHAILDEEYLRELMTEAGFVDIERIGLPRGRNKHREINMGIKGRKPCAS